MENKTLVDLIIHVFEQFGMKLNEHFIVPLISLAYGVEEEKVREALSNEIVFFSRVERKEADGEGATYECRCVECGEWNQKKAMEIAKQLLGEKAVAVTASIEVILKYGNPGKDGKHYTRIHRDITDSRCLIVCKYPRMAIRNTLNSHKNGKNPLIIGGNGDGMFYLNTADEKKVFILLGIIQVHG